MPERMRATGNFSVAPLQASYGCIQSV